MLSIGSLEGSKPENGPKYFSVDLDDDDQFPDLGAGLAAKVSDEVDGNVVSGNRKLSKERRMKVKQTPSGSVERSKTDLPPPPRVSEDHTRVRRKPMSHRVRFGVSGCLDDCCRPEGPKHQRDTQANQVEPQGSNLGLPPVADDDRQALFAENDQESNRHHVESKPQTLKTQVSQMSGKEMVAIRRAQRFLEKTTGMSRGETDLMSE